MAVCPSIRDLLFCGSQAYARSDLFERRRRLMADWAAYLSGAPGP